MTGTTDIAIFRETTFYVDNSLIKPQANEIVVEGQKHRVRQKVIEVLAYMAANAGEVVSREEMLERLWSTQPSSDEVLTQVISELRKLLQGSQEGGAVIETIPKVGYRLTATVRVEAIQPKSFGSVAPPVQPTADHLAFYHWAEGLARQNRFLWVAVVALALMLSITAAVLFGWGPYGETITVTQIDGVTTTERHRGFIEDLEGDEDPPTENDEEGSSQN